MCRAMNSRTVFTCSAVAGVAGVAAIGLCVFGLSGHDNAATHRAGHTTTASAGHRHSAKAYTPVLRLLPTRANLQLKWSPMDALAPSKHAHHYYANITITRATVAPPLNLKLPANTPRDVGPIGHNRSSRLATIQTARGPLIDPLAINLDPNIRYENTALARDTHLFNRNNGLRGFMARNWLNKTVGVQGGLAIKEDRLRQGSNGLRDNMAVGMGVLLAF